MRFKPWMMLFVAPFVALFIIIFFPTVAQHRPIIRKTHKQIISQIGVNDISQEFIGLINQAGVQYHNAARFKAIHCQRVALSTYSCILKQSHPSACKKVKFTLIENTINIQSTHRVNEIFCRNSR